MYKRVALMVVGSLLVVAVGSMLSMREPGKSKRGRSRKLLGSRKIEKRQKTTGRGQQQERGKQPVPPVLDINHLVMLAMESGFQEGRIGKILLNGDCKQVVDEVSAGIDVNLPDGKGRTLLYAACSTNNIFVVQSLLERGALINQLDGPARENPLCLICRTGKLELLKMFVQTLSAIAYIQVDGQEYKVPTRLYIRDAHTLIKQGNTPLDIAEMANQKEIVEYLKSLGAKNHVSKKLLQEFKQAVCDGNCEGLAAAHKRGCTKMNYCIDVNAQTVDNHSLLYFACTKVNQTEGTEQRLRVVTHLGAYGALIDAVDPTAKESPLGFACRTGNLELLKELVRCGKVVCNGQIVPAQLFVADIFGGQDSTREDLLKLAGGEKKEDVIKYLKEIGVQGRQ